MPPTDPPRGGNHWIIGDVHGCGQSLRHLVGLFPREDRLILCGDVINRGPQIAMAMDLAWQLVTEGRAIWLMGNHEQDLLRDLSGHDLESQDLLHASRTYRDLGESACRAWAPRLSQLPTCYRGGGWIATHAGLDSAGRPDLPVRSPFWCNCDARHGDVIVGHAPGSAVRRLGSIVFVDTGACYGGRLSAYCPETGSVRSAPGQASQ